MKQKLKRRDRREGDCRPIRGKTEKSNGERGH